MSDLSDFSSVPDAMTAEPMLASIAVEEALTSAREPEGSERDAHRSPLPRRPGRRHLALRLGWNVGDQIISSLTNLSLSLVVARSVQAESFGAFSVAFIVFQVGVLVTRALVGQALSMRFSAREATVFRPAAAGATGAALLIGLVVGGICVVAGLVSDNLLGHVLVVIGVGLPGLLLQDTWRMVFFAQLRPARAAANDFLWMVLQVALVAAALVLHVKHVTIFVGIWSATAAAAALFGFIQFSMAPTLRRSWAYLRAQWDITRFLMAELVVVQGSYQGALLAIGAIGTLSDVGALRGAMVLIGPVAILAVSITAFGIPELSRRRDLKHDGPKIAAVVSLGMMAASVGWISVFLALPDSAGHALLGASWSNARAVLVPSMIYQLGLCASDGPALVIYALGKTRESFRLHAVFSVLLVVGALVGLELDGARGAALGMGIDSCLLAPAWWILMWKLLHATPGAAAGAAAGQARVESTQEVTTGAAKA